MTIIIDVDGGFLQAFTIGVGVGKRINKANHYSSVIT
jgi:hypothetical protein